MLHILSGFARRADTPAQSKTAIRNAVLAAIEECKQHVHITTSQGLKDSRFFMLDAGLSYFEDHGDKQDFTILAPFFEDTDNIIQVGAKNAFEYIVIREHIHTPTEILIANARAKYLAQQSLIAAMPAASDVVLDSRTTPIGVPVNDAPPRAMDNRSYTFWFAAAISIALIMCTVCLALRRHS